MTRIDPAAVQAVLDAVARGQREQIPEADLPPSPLLVILKDIANSLDLISRTLDAIDVRDSMWRRM